LIKGGWEVQEPENESSGWDLKIRKHKNQKWIKTQVKKIPENMPVGTVAGKRKEYYVKGEGRISSADAKRRGIKPKIKKNKHTRKNVPNGTNINGTVELAPSKRGGCYKTKDIDGFIFVNSCIKGLGNFYLIPTSKMPKNQRDKSKVAHKMRIHRNELKKYEIK
jgi:hypothetical protein